LTGLRRRGRSIARSFAAHRADAQHPDDDFYAVRYGPNGHARRVEISLPYISCIADAPRYLAPPSPLPQLSEFERREQRSRPMTERVIRRALGRDPEKPDPQFEAVLRRIEREGV
jgi:hypothetical protein